MSSGGRWWGGGGGGRAGVGVGGSWGFGVRSVGISVWGKGGGKGRWGDVRLAPDGTREEMAGGGLHNFRGFTWGGPRDDGGRGGGVENLGWGVSIGRGAWLDDTRRGDNQWMGVGGGARGRGDVGCDWASGSQEGILYVG